MYIMYNGTNIVESAYVRGRDMTSFILVYNNGFVPPRFAKPPRTS